MTPKTIALGAAVVLLLSSYALAVNAARLGTYTCRVKSVYGTDATGKTWRDAKLVYDADAGTLYVGLVIFGDLPRLPLSRVYSRLRVEVMPSPETNLVAVQYDRVGERGNVRPIIAWLMIETLEDPDRPAFQFFSNSIRVIVTGECVHGL